MANNNLINKLSNIVGEENITNDDLTLNKVAADETPLLDITLPLCYITPTSATQVQNIVSLCSKENIAIFPRGAGTGKSGGAVPTKAGIVLGFEKMNKIIKINTDDLTAVVQPGVILADLKNAVNNHGLYYPPDPASYPWCFIGGNIAENASGPSTLKYGSTKDYVLGLEIVLADGKKLKIGKNTIKGVCGYDLVSLICGSEGTLAIITEAVLRLIPKPQGLQTALLTFNSQNNAAEAVSVILSRRILPKSIEFIDEVTINALKKAHAPFSFAHNAKACLIVECDGYSDNESLQQLSDIITISESFNLLQQSIASNIKQRRNIWQTREMCSHALRQLSKKISEDIVVPRSKIPYIIGKIYQLGEKYGLTTCGFGHAGDGNIHAQILFKDNKQMDKVENLIFDLLKETVKIGGSISAEHGIGLLRKPYLHLEQDKNVIDLQKNIKNIFDPKGILNPDKIF